MEKSGMSPQQGEVLISEQSGMNQVKSVVSKINHVINTIGKWMFYLRKFVLAAPVVYYALQLAAMNNSSLPEQVGINLQASGEFAFTVSRGFAVMGPLALTFACLFLMFCSRKAMYAWAISLFTLTLPLLLLFSNLYPM